MTLENKAQQTFNQFLDADESIIWAGKPERIPYLVPNLIFLGIGVLWLIMDLGLLAAIDSVIAIPFALLHLTPFWLSAYAFYYSYNNHSAVLYAYTAKKILIKDGAGANITIIPMEKLEEVLSRAHPVETKYNVGTLDIYSGKKSTKGRRVADSFYSIPQPLHVLADLNRRIKAQS